LYILKNIYYTTGATSGAGTAFLSEVHEFTMVFSGVRVTRSLVLCVMFVDHCLSFCIFILAIVLSVLLRLTDSDYPLVSSNSSYSELYVQCTVFLFQILEIMVFSSSFFPWPWYIITLLHVWGGSLSVCWIPLSSSNSVH
jgi:hypothetical protein